VCAVFAHHAEPAVAVAESYEILAEQTYAHRCSVAFRNFLRQAGRQPVPPHDLSHRRVAFDATEQVVVFR